MMERTAFIASVDITEPSKIIGSGNIKLHYNKFTKSHYISSYTANFHKEDWIQLSKEILFSENYAIYPQFKNEKKPKI